MKNKNQASWLAPVTITILTIMTAYFAQDALSRLSDQEKRSFDTSVKMSESIQAIKQQNSDQFAEVNQNISALTSEIRVLVAVNSNSRREVFESQQITGPNGSVPQVR